MTIEHVALSGMLNAVVTINYVSQIHAYFNLLYSQVMRSGSRLKLWGFSSITMRLHYGYEDDLSRVHSKKRTIILN